MWCFNILPIFTCGVFNVLELSADDTASLGDESSFFLRIEDTDEPESLGDESSCGVFNVLELPADDTRSITGVTAINGSFIFPMFSSGFCRDLKISPDVFSWCLPCRDEDGTLLPFTHVNRTLAMIRTKILTNECNRRPLGRVKRATVLNKPFMLIQWFDSLIQLLDSAIHFQVDDPTNSVIRSDLSRSGLSSDPRSDWYFFFFCFSRKTVEQNCWSFLLLQ